MAHPVIAESAANDVERLLCSLVGVARARLERGTGGMLRRVHILRSDDIREHQVIRNVVSGLSAGFGVQVDVSAVRVHATAAAFEDGVPDRGAAVGEAEAGALAAAAQAAGAKAVNAPARDGAAAPAPVAPAAPVAPVAPVVAWPSHTAAGVRAVSPTRPLPGGALRHMGGPGNGNGIGNGIGNGTGNGHHHDHQGCNHSSGGHDHGHSPDVGHGNGTDGAGSSDQFADHHDSWSGGAEPPLHVSTRAGRVRAQFSEAYNSVVRGTTSELRVERADVTRRDAMVRCHVVLELEGHRYSAIADVPDVLDAEAEVAARVTLDALRGGAFTAARLEGAGYATVDGVSYMVVVVRDPGTAAVRAGTAAVGPSLARSAAEAVLGAVGPITTEERKAAELRLSRL
jgi:hypothetical protein